VPDCEVEGCERDAVAKLVGVGYPTSADSGYRCEPCLVEDLDL